MFFYSSAIKQPLFDILHSESDSSLFIDICSDNMGLFCESVTENIIQEFKQIINECASVLKLMQKKQVLVNQHYFNCHIWHIFIMIKWFQ